MANTPKNNPKTNPPDDTPKLDVTAASARSASAHKADDFVAGPDNEDPVSKAYARVGRPDTVGVSGLPESDEDAGEERKKLYKKGAGLVSRID